MPKIFLTGGSGFIGSRFIQRWKNEYEILSPSHHELDITDADAVTRYVVMHLPDIILHIAAISNTGYCQEHPEESYLVNTLATITLAKAAKQVGAKFIFFSSDQVYNGNAEKGLLSEKVTVCPQNHYGCHKLEAENSVLDIIADAVLLRATWMYDLPCTDMPAHPNFFTNIKHAMISGTPLYFAINEHRGITHTSEIIEQLPITFGLPGGVYNYGAENIYNTYETAFNFVKQWKGENMACDIIKADEARFAEQPRNISISLDKIREVSGGRINFSNTLEGLLKFSSSASNEHSQK